MITVIAKGNITQDLELKSSAKTDVLPFDIAVKRPFSDTSDFYHCVAFGNVASFVARNFKKGQPILIQGHLQNDNYSDKDGNKRIITKIIADQVEFAGYPKNSEEERKMKNRNSVPKSKNADSETVDIEHLLYDPGTEFDY